MPIPLRLSGLAAARPTAAAAVGARFFATDTLAVTFSTGSEWVTSDIVELDQLVNTISGTLAARPTAGTCVGCLYIDESSLRYEAFPGGWATVASPDGTPSFAAISGAVEDNAALAAAFAAASSGPVVEARTATATGATTGTVSATTTHVTVTSANADHIIILPAPVAGKGIVLDVGANGFELRSSAPATIAINGGAGASAESAIPANSTIRATCLSATAWRVESLTCRVQTQDALTDNTGGTAYLTLPTLTPFVAELTWDGATYLPSAADETALNNFTVNTQACIASLAAQLAKIKVDLARVLYVEAAA